MSRYVPVENRAHGEEIRAGNRRRKVEREQQAVERYLDEHCQDITQGRCENPLSEQRVDGLFAAIITGVTGQALKVRHNYLAHRLQQAAREHNLDVPNRQRMVVLHGESAPVTPLGFEGLAITRAWVDGFWSDIDSPRDLSDADEQKIDAGRLIFGFIAFGGVHGKKKLQMLIDAIPKGVRYWDGLTWMDVETGQGLWRWFPDPVSTLLLQRWYKTYGANRWPSGKNTDAARLLFNFLHFLDCIPSEEARPNVVLRTLIEASATRDATWIEGAFHHVQRSPGVTVSLPSDAWARLLTKKVLSPLPQTKSEAKNKPVTELRPLTGVCDSDIYAGVRDIQRVLTQATRISEKGEGDRTYQQLAAIAENGSWAPIIRVLASWAAHLRRYGGRQKRLVTSSIRRYLSTIANPLATILSATDDLNALGEDEWQEVYDRLLSGAPSGKRLSNRAIVAGWFHEYMVEQFGMPEVEIEGATVNAEVDANILTPAEYVRTQGILAHSDASSRLTQIRQIVLTLGFRCGLRRTEVQKILVKDVQGLLVSFSSRPELLTRGNKFAGQKSGSGTRRLPLWALLTEDELRRLRDWYQCRLREPNTKQNDLLFSAPQRGYQLIPQSQLFSPIQESMRMASGTASLRFHHLRHSCVTLIGLRLFERRLGELMLESWARDDSGNMIMPHWGKDVFAIANRSEEWAPTRKKLWFLALLAGHASPGQTLLSYTHLMDYINGVRQTERRLPSLTLRAQANLLGLSRGSVEVFRNRNGLKGTTTARELATAVHRRWPAGVCRAAGKNLTNFVMPASSAFSERLDPEPYTAFMIYDAVSRFNRMVAEGYAREEAVLTVAERFALAAGTLDAWLERGEGLMNQHVRDGSCRSRYSRDSGKTAQSIAFRGGVGGVVMPALPECPAPPKAKLAQALVEDIFERVRRWLRDEPEPARYALQTVSDAITSSKTQISHTLDENKRVYLQFLGQAGLMHLVRIRVRAPENGLPDRELKRHWSELFQVPLSRVAIVSQKSRGDRFRYGSVQVEVRPEPKLGSGASQNTMNALRFAVFMLMLACAGERTADQTKEGGKA